MGRNEGKRAKKGRKTEPKIILTPKTDYDHQNKNYSFFCQLLYVQAYMRIIRFLLFVK